MRGNSVKKKKTNRKSAIPTRGLTCKFPPCRRFPMKPRALWKLRNRGNHGHRYAVEWRCDQCTNVVSEYLPEQHWLNLAKSSHTSFDKALLRQRNMFVCSGLLPELLDAAASFPSAHCVTSQQSNS